MKTFRQTTIKKFFIHSFICIISLSPILFGLLFNVELLAFLIATIPVFGIAPMGGVEEAFQYNERDYNTSKKKVRNRKKRAIYRREDDRFEIIYRTFFFWICVNRVFNTEEEAIEWLSDNDERGKIKGYLK